VQTNLELKFGLNMVDGLITYKGVADAFHMKYTPVDAILR